MEDTWHPHGTAELERAWQVVRSALAASLCVQINGVAVGAMGLFGNYSSNSQKWLP
jgi:hypothetical protein